MRKIHYRNDFEVDVTLTVGGVPIAVPDHDFDIVFVSKRGGNQYTCSRKGDNWVNCREENNVVKCFLDNHSLSTGVLQVEYWDFAPNSDYVDGSKRTITPQNLDIELVKGAGDVDTIVSAEVVADLNAAIAEAVTATTNAQEAVSNAQSALDTANDIIIRLSAIEPYNKAEVDNLLSAKANTADVYAMQDVDDMLDTKQDTLTFDPAPTRLSDNPVTSNGVFNALAEKADLNGSTSQDFKARALFLGNGHILFSDSGGSGRFSFTYGNNECYELPVNSSADTKTFAFSDDIPTAVSELTNDSGYATTSEMDAALGNKQDTISDLETIRGDASKGATAYQKPSDGIPKSDLASTVQTSLNKADTALQSYTESDPVFSASAAAGISSSDITNWNSKTSNVGTLTGITMNGTSKGTSGVVDLGTVITEHQPLDNYATNADYDSTAKKIYLKHGDTILSSIDATAFIKDGMVDTVAITGGNLVITFNTDSGKNPISIPISDIFNANNYYTKSDIDNAGFLTNETDPIFTASAAYGISSADITNWNSKTSNVGTITGIKMNGVSKGTSGVVDLGTVLTSYTETDPTVPNWAKQPNKPAYTANEVGALPNTTEIPSKTSDLINDSGFLTSYTETDPTVPSWAKASTKPSYTASEVGALPNTTVIPTKTSDLANDSNFVDNAAMSAALSGKQDAIGDLADIRSGASKGATAYQKPSGGIPKSDLASAVQTSLGKADTALQSYTETDPTVPSWAKAASKPTYTASEVGALPDSTAIPSKTSDLTNDSGFVVDADYVHTDSNYTAAEKSKLSGISAGAEANVQSDWSVTETTSDAFIKNKPTIPTESTVSGWGFTKNTGTITGIKMNGTSKGTSGVVDLGTVLTSYTESDPTVPNWAKQPSKPTYTASEVGALPNTTVIPSKTSDLTNDVGFVTGSKVYYGTCTTAAATNPKVVTVETFPTDGNGKPLVGTLICVKYSYTDTSTSTSPTINVNDTGDARIWVNNAVLATAKSPYHGYANRYISYMWDGTYWVWRTSGYDANTTYTNVALGHGYATQNNSSAATAITAALGSYALTANGIVSVRFTYDVPAGATLNVNGKGAKAIYHRNSPIAAGVIKAGDTATFVYSTYYHLLSVDRDEAGSQIDTSAFVQWESGPKALGSNQVKVNSVDISESGNVVSGDGYITFGNNDCCIRVVSGVLRVADYFGGLSDSTSYRFPAGVKGDVAVTKNYYTKTEIDTKIGNIETLLASI